MVQQKLKLTSIQLKLFYTYNGTDQFALKGNVIKSVENKIYSKRTNFKLKNENFLARNTIVTVVEKNFITWQSFVDEINFYSYVKRVFIGAHTHF